MEWFREWRIKAHSIDSLCWHGDSLVDWAGGGARYHLDGTTEGRYVIYAYSFDAAAISPSGQYAVIYTKSATKGVVLQAGEILREINRSFYFAGAYEYPIALFRMPDGREALVHCPDEYNRLEIEDLETGERLTESESRKPADLFHSRLQVSPDSRWLLSAGWIWHPCDSVAVYDLQEALRDPTVLDTFGREPPGNRYVDVGELSSATFLDNEHLLLANSNEDADGSEDDEDGPGQYLRPASLGVFNFITSAFRQVGPVRETVGTMMPVGKDYVIGFFDYPKLFDLRNGEVVHRWTEIKSGKQFSSIIGQDPVPPIALDPAHCRFAVADSEEIRVVQIDLPLLQRQFQNRSE